MQEAAESLSFYRRVPSTAKEVEVEITKIKLQMDPRIDKILQGENGRLFCKGIVAVDQYYRIFSSIVICRFIDSIMTRLLYLNMHKKRH